MAAVARTHADAILAWYPTQTNPLLMFDSAGPPGSPTGPYCVIYPSPGDRAAPTMALDYRRVTTTHQLSFFGGSEDEVLWAADKGADILGVRLVVAGRSVEPARFLGASPVTRDDATRNASGLPLFAATTDIAVTSQPT